MLFALFLVCVMYKTFIAACWYGGCGGGKFPIVRGGWTENGARHTLPSAKLTVLTDGSTVTAMHEPGVYASETRGGYLVPFRHRIILHGRVAILLLMLPMLAWAGNVDTI